MPKTSLPVCAFLSKITSIWSFESWIRHMRKESVWLIHYFSEPLTQGVFAVWCIFSLPFLGHSVQPQGSLSSSNISAINQQSEFFSVSLFTRDQKMRSTQSAKCWLAPDCCHRFSSTPQKLHLCFCPATQPSFHSAIRVSSQLK